MVNGSNIIQRIEEKYVGSNCVQVMFKHNHGLCIIKDKRIIFCDLPYSAEYGYINKYLQDDRRHQFPYSDVPEHNEVIEEDLYVVVNQLLEYDSIYTIIRSDNKNNVSSMVYCKVAKDEDDAIIVQSIDENSPYFNIDIDTLKNIAELSPEPKIRTKLRT